MKLTIITSKYHKKKLDLPAAEVLSTIQDLASNPSSAVYLDGNYTPIATITIERLEAARSITVTQLVGGG
jgi:hypothetical protein